MGINKDQAIVAGLTLLLLCFYMVSPVLGAETGKLRVLDKNGNEVKQAEIPDSIAANKVKVSSLNDMKAREKELATEKEAESETTEEDEEEEDSGSALDSLNPLNMGKKMVGEGGMYFLELLADAGFKVGETENQDTLSVKENYGNAVALIYLLATVEFDPSQNEFIQKMQLGSGVVGLMLILMFVILGAMQVNVSTIFAKNTDKAWLLSNRYHVPINEYALTLVEVGIMVAAGYVVLMISLQMELLFTKLIMFQVLDRIVPTGDNIVMYLIMSICYLIIGIAIAFRILVIGMFHAFYVPFIGLYCFGLTRPAAVAAWWYYIKMLFMRTVIVGITVAGVGIISYIKLPRDTGFDRVAGDLLIMFIHPILYSALVLILVIVCVMFILGIKNVISTSKYVIRKYTYGAYNK